MDPVDFTAVVFQLSQLPHASHQQIPPRWWGRAIYSAFLALVQRYDEALAETLHAETGLKPFTVSSLVRQKDGEGSAEKKYWFRLTGLGPQISEILIQSVQQGQPFSQGAAIELDYRPFLIEKVSLEPEEHPWAGSGRYADLMATQLVGNSWQSRRVAFQLVSPTLFRTNDRELPFPTPELVFNSLLERWNRFSPFVFPQDVRRFVSECVSPSWFNLRSRSASVNGGLRVGSIGSIRYTSANNDRYWMGILHTLAAYAQYAGIGKGTTMGFGQARQDLALPPDRAKNTAENTPSG